MNIFNTNNLHGFIIKKQTKQSKKERVNRDIFYSHCWGWLGNRGRFDRRTWRKKK